MNEKMVHMLRDRTPHSHHIKKSYEVENRALLRKIRDMTDEIISLKVRGPPPTQRDTEAQII